MNRIHPLRRYAPLALLLAFVVLACSLVGNDKQAQTFSFNKSFDTLAQFDSVVITLKDTTGKTIDILYRGKADTIHEVENRSAPHWDGDGIAILSVVGYDSGVVVYHVDKRINGKTDQVLDTIRIILPNTLLISDVLDITLTEGDSVQLPKISVAPAALSNKDISYVSSAPNQLLVGPNSLRAIQRGSVKLTATLVANPAKSLVFNVTILPNPLTPDSLFVSPDSLILAAGGAQGTLTAKVFPATADPAVTWMIRDASVALISAAGSVQGLKPGRAFAVAVSNRKPTLRDSSLILVTAPVAVAQVRFLKDSLDLFVGGAAESLLVQVLPAAANPAVTLISLDPAVVAVLGGRVQGQTEGSARIVANSVENPSVADTLKATVFPTQKIDAVKITPDSLRLYVGGATGSLAAVILPSASNQSVLWKSLDESIAKVDALGKVTGLSAGATMVVGQSRVDSTRKDTTAIAVKRDVPVISVGIDTVVSLGATVAIRPKVVQEYGGISQFRWDLNGDGTFEGTSDSLKTVSATYAEAKEVRAAFYIKDGEGNEVTVYKKIKAVAGPAVLIVSPLDSSYTNQFTIPVLWTVSGKEQDSLKTQVLKLGANSITRSAKDEAGNAFSASVTVIVDTTPPNKPVVHGPTATADNTPTWTWASGGGGGSGNYKFWLDVDDASKGLETKDTVYTPATELAEGTHTLFVAERDRAGNWSLSGRLALKIDVSAPTQPKVSTSPASPTNVRKPKWSWISGGGGGIGAYQYKLDNNNLLTGATATTDTAFTPAANLTVGTHTLYVQERDSAGNWSPSGSAGIVIDTIPPSPPTVTATQTSPTNEPKPTWNWTSGGGGKGFYRYKIGDTVWASGGLQGAVTTYTPATAQAEGVKTLYVSEQDSAGNWSAAGSFGLTLDLTAPGMPKMDSTPYSPLNSLKPTWTWTTGTGGNGAFRCRVDNGDLSTGTTQISSGSFSQPTDLPEGKHTLYVQERDAAGNWSSSGKRELVLAQRSPTGGSNFVSVGYRKIHSVISKTGDIYASTVDVNDSSKSLIMKYTGSAWVKIGKSDLGLHAFGELPIAVSEAGIPYVVFTEDASRSYKGSVARFNGTGWEIVGTRAFTDGMITYPSIAIGPGDVPYIAYKDDANSSKLTVMRLFGGTWEYAGGKPGISDGSTDETAITIGSNGKQYVVHLDQSGPSQYTVFGYNGIEWIKLGALPSYGSIPSLAVSAGGVLFACYHTSSDGKAAVVKWNGSAFENIGPVGISDAAVNGVSMKIGKTDLPVIAYEDRYPDTGTASSRPTVMRYTGTKWENVGPARFLDGNIWSLDLMLDANDVPNVIFNGQSLGGSGNLMRAVFDN